MASTGAPNWLRIIILILSFISFLPQLHRLLLRRNSSGISLYYALVNVINSVELFTMTFYFVVNNVEPGDAFVHNPPDLGDWLNLAQVTIVAVLWLIIFALCLFLPSDHNRAGLRATVTGILISYLLVSVVPIFIDAASPETHNGPYRKWAGAFFQGIHSLFINPIVTVLAIAAFLFQGRETLSRPAPEALSLIGLVVQAVVFALATLAWPWRLVFPWDELDGYFTFGVLITWYQLVGWVVVNNAIFVIVQAMLFRLAIYHRRQPRIQLNIDGQTDSLLRE